MRTPRTDQTRRADAFKEAAFTSRMAEEARNRARAAWKDAKARGCHPDQLRALEVQAAVTHSRATAAATLEDEAWRNYAATLPHG
ncbi:hypothetical protein QEX65_gp20 [Arthrobacter phage Noely]|uniref:Uncharacterized protein n=1 Tax=Arthrobacter phage Noely TaxID=2419964 RepID=A0A3G2KAF4_9CAUD|nr:hypothetical protein QEX65_gp20 [Arthrobacter phage Noely]AYN55961.1 hypothetical protein PBI_NOELY_20 [Arthrobacter phage Noely]